MKLAITCYPTHGGSGVIASELALGLAEGGHEVHIVSYATPFRLRAFHQNVFLHEVEVASYPLFKYPFYELALAGKLVELTQQYGLQLVHSHYAVPHATSAYLARQILGRERLKTVTTLHGTDITLVGLDRSFFELVRFSIQASDGVTAVSHYLKKRTIEEFGIDCELQVIPNFVDSRRYRRSWENCAREHFAPHGEKILMHTSNFRPVKRILDVVETFSRVHQALPCKLLLIGDGPERQNAQRRAHELNVHADVIFLGEQDFVERLLSCADLFLLPSQEESFGLAALEALACGVPVIATRVGGLPEVVDEGTTGFLLETGDVEGMARRALQLLEDDSLLLEFQNEARRRAVERYDRSLIVPRYEAFYQQVLGI